MYKAHKNRPLTELQKKLIV